jgi:hypothetical protein
LTVCQPAHFSIACYHDLQILTTKLDKSNFMVKNPETPQPQFSWQAIGWRLILTLLLLAVLAGSTLTVFGSATTSPDSRVLPTLSADAAGVWR